MQSLAVALACWLALSLLFGLFWMLSAVALREARRRWPQMAVDRAWAAKPLGPRAGRDTH